MSAEARLAELGIELPPPLPPVASYVPWTRAGNLVFVSGQGPADAQGLRMGHVGGDLTEEQGAEAARLCAINVLSQLRAAAGSLDDLARIVKLTVFVASAPGFTRQPWVANGASDLMVEVFGDAGRHTRSAIGCNELPLGMAVEVEAIAEVAG